MAAAAILPSDDRDRRVRWFSPPVCAGFSLCSSRRGGEPGVAHWWFDPCLGANLFAGHRLIDFEPTRGSAGTIVSVTVRRAAILVMPNPLHVYLYRISFGSSHHGGAKCASRPMRQPRPMRFPNIPLSDIPSTCLTDGLARLSHPGTRRSHSCREKRVPDRLPDRQSLRERLHWPTSRAFRIGSNSKIGSAAL